MAYTMVLVMKSVAHSHGKTFDPKDNYSYRLLEVDIEPGKGALYVRQPYNIRPLLNDNNDEDDKRKNLYQGNISPQRTRTHFTSNEDKEDENENKEIGKNSNNDNHIDSDKVVITKAKKFNGKSSMQNSYKKFNMEIPDDFQNEISQLRIPRRVTRKRKSKLSPKKVQQQEAPSDMDADADMDMDMNMDMNMDMDMDVNVNAEPGEEDPYGGNGDSNDGGEGHGGNEHDHQQELEHEDKHDQEKHKKKSRKRYKNQNQKQKKNRNINSGNIGVIKNTENDKSGGEIENDNVGDDENNHQEEEEEVEEKKEKVHKVTIKKKRPYLNETKVMLDSVVPAKYQADSGSGAGFSANGGTSVSQLHFPLPYQGTGIVDKPKKKKVKGGAGGGTIMTPTAISWQNQLQNNIAQPGQLVKLLKPLISQETAAANTINPNHLAESPTVRKGIKPRDVNLILRTKHSPRILIRRYKPLLGAYPVGVGVGLNLQQHHKRLGLYHRPHKTRKKVCRKCKKKMRQYPLYANAYPNYASDVDSFHPSNAMATGTTQCPHTGLNHNQHYSSSSNTESPQQMINSAIGTVGPTYPWYGTPSPDHYNPNNKFEYVDENLISPRLPSQPVNTYVPMPVKSGRSDDDNDNDSSNHNHKRNKNQNQNQNEYQTSLPLLSDIDSTGNSGTNDQSLDESDDLPQKQEHDKDDNDEKKSAPTDTHIVQETDTDNDNSNEKDNDKDNDPYVGHKKVEQLAAIHQQETDAGLFDEDHNHSPLQHRHSHLLQDAAESTAPVTKILDEFQNEQDLGLDVEAEMAEEDEDKDEDKDEENTSAMATLKEGPPEGQAEENDEEDQHELEYIDKEYQNGGENSQSDKLFDSWLPGDIS